MASKSVFLALHELFPQVDQRILKAVAIEHANDVDAAAEFVISDVLTSLNESASDVRSREQDTIFGNQGDATVYASFPYTSIQPEANASSDENARSVEVHDISSNKYIGGSVEQCEPISNVVIFDDEIMRTNCLDGSEEQDSKIPAQEDELQPSQLKDAGVIQLNASFLDEVEVVAIPVSASPDQLNDEPEEASSNEHMFDTNDLEGNCSSNLYANFPDLNKSHEEENDEDVPEHVAETSEQQPLVDALTVPSETCAQVTSLSVAHGTNGPLQCGTIVPNNVSGDFVEWEENNSACGTFKISEQSCGYDMVSLDESDLPIALTSRSGHVNIDLLEDFLTDARSNKQTLVSSVEAVISMVQEGEGLEERAKQAQKEASFAGQEALSNAEELEQILKDAKHKNEMRAGDIYGEKAVLSTEARELQSRLLSLSDERSKSFKLIEEIRQTVEARLAAAQDEIRAAEQEKLELEENSQKALNEHEVAMKMVVEESERLQQQADENAKLRDFLIDRGNVVDTLQGELAVIFEDVISLKGKIDGRLALGGSLMSVYSSSLSSSSLSQRSWSLAKSPIMSKDGNVSAGSQFISLTDSVETIKVNDDSKVPEDENSCEVINANGSNKVIEEEEDWELCNSEA